MGWKTQLREGLAQDSFEGKTCRTVDVKGCAHVCTLCLFALSRLLLLVFARYCSLFFFLSFSSGKNVFKDDR